MPEYADAAPKKKKTGLLSKDEAQGLVRELVQGCVNFAEDTLSPDREKATKYYKGEKFGNEKDGRSQVVVTEVRDQIRGVLPSFMRVIFGPERVVEFRPRGKDSEPQARNQTDCVQYIFTEENPGFMETMSVIKDGLIRRLGGFKYWWVADERATDSYSTMTVEAYNALVATPDVKISRAMQKEDGSYGTVEYTKPRPGYVCVRAIKTEQILFNALARDTGSAMFLGHQEEVTRGELIAMGYPKKLVDEVGQVSRTLDTNAEALERIPNEEKDPEAGKANDKILYVEGYARVDLDNDDVQELRKLCMIGPGFEIGNGDGYGEVVDHVPFVYFCPDPEPHTLNGHSLADLVMDLQLTESSLVRSMLDSLAMSIFPRTAYVEGQANHKDIMNTEVGATIRERAPGMVREFAHTFVGKEALSVLEFYRGLGERRTGQSNGANDLDLDALQSTTKSGVDAAISGSQAQTELMVRVFAETTLKPLFKGIAHIYKKNFTGEPRDVKVRGKWIKMDPKTWDADEVTVAVALGAMLPEKKLQILAQIKETQEQYLTTLGPSNPIVSLHQLTNTLSRAVELSGFPASDEFFNAVPPDWKPPTPTQPEQPSPEMLVAQIEQQKVQNQQAKDQATLQLKAQELALQERKMQQDAALTTRQMELDAELKRMELELEYNTKIETAKLDAQVKAAAHQDRLAFDREMGEKRLALDSQKAEHGAVLAEDAHTHGQKVAEHSAQLDEGAQEHAQDMAERAATEATN